MKRILREDVLNVGNEKFLMLLLVMEAENEDALDLGEQRFVCIRDQIDHAFVDDALESGEFPRG